MHPQKRNDFRIVEKKRNGTIIWSILYGGTPFTNCRDYESAVELARQLNLDPYYLGRGQTQADRAKSWIPIK
jgi:hypothetical protein